VREEEMMEMEEMMKLELEMEMKTCMYVIMKEVSVRQGSHCK